MLLGNGNAQSSTDATGAMSVSVYPNFVVSAQHLTTRNRVIFPYLRRLLESHKAASVTKRRVDFLNEQIQPDDEIRRVFNEKYAEAMQVCILFDEIIHNIHNIHSKIRRVQSMLERKSYVHIVITSP